MGKADMMFSYDEFKNIIDELFDEVLIYDNNYKIVYINKACERHYGMSQEEMIGLDFWDLEGEFWDLSVLPHVYNKLDSVMQIQKSKMGAELHTIAVPIFDDNNKLKYVAMSVRDNIKDSNIQSLEDIKKKKLKETIKFKNEYFYTSEKMKDIINLAKSISNADSPCLILGESGVGKTLLGKYIHENSKRNTQPFIHINCAAINKELIESELFGYVKGSFTGANKTGKKGLAEEANGGTLFLDEISEIPYKLQSKLLQFIQEKRFYPVGSNKYKEVDIRIITATNRDLKTLVQMGSFREDLYYRLNVFEIEIPPLRERPEEILLLCDYFLNQYCLKYNKNHRLSKEVKEIFLNFSWKGNIRELSHIIERLVVITNEIIIRPWHLPKHFYEIKSSKVEPSGYKIDYRKGLDEIIDEISRQIVIDVYNKEKSTRKVAKSLKISQSKAFRLIHKYELNNENKL